MKKAARLIMTGLLLILGWVAGPLEAAQIALGPDVIIDCAGRRVSFAPYQRVISLYGAHTENLFALGAGAQLIGVTRHDQWPPEAKTKAMFSYHDDLEKFLAARPDLVLIRPMIDRGYAPLIHQLEGHGITVVSLQPRTIEEMYVYWQALGNLVGRSAQARSLVAAFQASVAELRQRTVSQKPKKRVYFEAIHARMRTFSPHAMAIFALESAGGINVAGAAQQRRYTNIADFGKERILALGDQIDVYLAQYGPMNRPTIEQIRAEPGFQTIRAIRNGQVFLIDEQLVSRPTPRMLEGICRIGGILYPGLFSNCHPTIPGNTGPPETAKRFPSQKDKKP